MAQRKIVIHQKARYAFDKVGPDVKADISTEVRKYDELTFETTFEAREDSTATIKEVTRLQKICHLDRSIGDSLKRLYDYRCQMTGEKVDNAWH